MARYTLISDEDVKKSFNFNSLPGTHFVQVDAFQLVHGTQLLLLLACVKVQKDDAKVWTDFTYLFVMRKDLTDKWIPTPWLSKDLTDVIAKSPSPDDTFKRLPEDILTALEAFPTIDEVIKLETARLEKTVEKAAKASELVTKGVELTERRKTLEVAP